MRLLLELLDPQTQRLDNVVLESDPEAPIDDVVRALNTIQPGPIFFGSTQLQGPTRLSDSGLVDGTRLTSGSAATSPSIYNTTKRELAVVSGPCAGSAFPLYGESIVIGRTPEVDITVDDPAISRKHLRISVSESNMSVEDLGSANGTMLEGTVINGSSPLLEDQFIEAGSSVFVVRKVPALDADIRHAEGVVDYNRPPRIRPASNELKFTFPAASTHHESPSFPWAQVVPPIVASVVAAVALHHTAFLAFSVIGAVPIVINALSNTRRGGKRVRVTREQHAAEVEKVRSAIADATVEERTQVRYLHPDARTLWWTAIGPGKRLWERRFLDSDALALRIGLGKRKASFTVVERGLDTSTTHPEITGMPIAVSLREVGVLGIAGPVQQVRNCARWLVAQVALLHSPRQFSVVLLTDTQSGADWNWMRWLPHARTQDADMNAPAAMIGNDTASRTAWVNRLTAILEARQEAQRNQRDATFDSAYVMVLDGVRDLRSIPGVVRLLKEGPGVEIYAIGLDSDATRLAEEGRASVVINSDDPSTATVHVEGRDEIEDVIVDQTSAQWAYDVAKAISPLRDAGNDERGTTIPTSLRLIDAITIDLENPEDLTGRWRMKSRSTAAIVGALSDGPFIVDIKEHGPHALVAGTTGSGKSEFLQTLVASLAVANRPDAMNFVLVDYKGESAFADCNELPHTVGSVSNLLDTRLTERALISLDAELKRREERLRELNAGNIDDAWEANPILAAQHGLARLLIVIDEFAELVHEVPDFVSGLIRVARVGRSLGVHLVFATQRPAGVVTPEMKANTGLRIGLRMEDKTDSAEILDANDAAFISRATPGRGYARMGGGTGLTEFQTARVAGRRKGESTGVSPSIVATVPWERVGSPLNVPVQSENKSSEETDLRALVHLIRQAAALEQVPKSMSPWLPPLPETLSLSELATDNPLKPAFAIEDIPSQQQQRPFVFDLVNSGHLAIVGSPRSGRSTTLRTLAAAIASSASADDVHLYGLDFGNGMLLPLADLPHCGAIVTRTETERAEQLLQRIMDEISRRQAEMARNGFGDINEQRRSGDKPFPYIVVLLDRWEGFTGQFPVDGSTDAQGTLLRILREGPSAGVRVVISGDRTVLTDRISAQIESRLVLRFSDRDDYRLAGIDIRSAPALMNAGRALRPEFNTDVQIALIDGTTDTQTQNAALSALASTCTPPSNDNSPFRVDALPSAISFADASAMTTAHTAETLWALVGVGGVELAAVGVDLAKDGPGFVVGGPVRSGRSTALVAIARSLTAKGVHIVTVTPRQSPLRELSAHELTTSFEDSFDAEDLKVALQSATTPVVVLVDDADSLLRSPTDDVISSWMKSLTQGNGGIVIAGQSEEMRNELRGMPAQVRKSRSGLLLSPTSTLDGQLLGVTLDRSLVGRTPAGRGVLFVSGEPVVTQVPL